MSIARPTLFLPSEADTIALANRIASLLRAGDVVLLAGPIGAGKSFFARALIRARLGNPAEEVPSPTFTVVQTYQADGVEIWHCDLYRLSSTQDVFELGLDDAFTQAICLIEWPDRLGDLAPADAIVLTFQAKDDYHSVTFSGSAPWAKRLESILG